MTNIFSAQDLQKTAYILSSPYSKFSSLTSEEIKNLAVVWCYYSGKIEGNTYTYVETEALLKDNITSERSYSDAKMLKNLYNTFITIVASIKKNNTIKIDRHTIMSIHSTLTEELIDNRKRGKFRTMPVMISGTSYIPPKEELEIIQTFENILQTHSTITNPLEKALFLHCNIARLQPFIDGNKRTSRVLESIELLNNDIIPVYSAKESDLLKYRKGVVDFYENQNYKTYVDYFLGRQLERLDEVSPSNYPKFSIEKQEVVKNRNKGLSL